MSMNKDLSKKFIFIKSILTLEKLQVSRFILKPDIRRKTLLLADDAD
jgi:hypothetical protein